MTALMTYTIDDITSLINNGFQYQLTDKCLDKISDIAEKVGAPSYVKTPIFHKKKKNVVTVDDKNRYNKMVTKQDENKCQVSLMGESINQIRICLNKLTEKTYSTVEGKIIDLMTQIINNEDLTESELLQIGKHVFEIASSNKFYSFLYATLLKKILSEFNTFNDIIYKCISEFELLFENIEYIDSNKDYDGFCRINKINDKRRSMSLFMTNLMKCKIIEYSRVYNIILGLLADVDYYITRTESKEICQEIIENTSLLINNSKDILLEQEECWEHLRECFSNYKTYTTKDYPGLSSKTRFKIIDIWDFNWK
jgi:hypothetical protein